MTRTAPVVVDHDRLVDDAQAMSTSGDTDPRRCPVVDLEGALAGAGLRPASRRALLGAAFVSAMSSGSVARVLGPVAPVVLVFTWPLELLGAWATRGQLICRRGAVAQVVAHDARPLPRPGMAALLGVALVVYGAAAAAAVSVLAGLPYPSALRWWWVLFVVVYAVNFVPDLVATKAWVRWRRPPSLSGLTGQQRAVMVFGVAAYPRGRGHGRALLQDLNSILDAAGTAAVLTARAQPAIAVGRRLAPSGVDRLDLVDLYASLGYRSVPVRRPPADWPGRDRGRPYPGRRMLRLPVSGNRPGTAG